MTEEIGARGKEEQPPIDWCLPCPDYDGATVVRHGHLCRLQRLQQVTSDSRRIPNEQTKLYAGGPESCDAAVRLNLVPVYLLSQKGLNSPPLDWSVDECPARRCFRASSFHPLGTLASRSEEL